MGMSDVKARRARVFALRQQGLVFREIGEKLGISTSRATQLYHKGVEDAAALRSIKDFTVETPVELLPIRPQAREVLLRYGVPLSDLILRDRVALSADMLRLPNCNRRTWNEIEAVLDQCLQPSV
jgi:orotate phosphoribosyltransferase-like protein